MDQDWIETDLNTNDLLNEYQDQQEAVFTRATEIAEQYDAPLETATGYGPIKEALITYVTEHDSDLIVLGVSGPPPRTTLLFDPLIAQLIQQAPVPVLGVSAAE